ncbi:MAG TPA: BMP family ABC transporter substrate-binding protein, partial [Candidimonas sp.]|nr:BMP family ABC transporter substrate-binding protein [Candidimonas sp.]
VPEDVKKLVAEKQAEIVAGTLAPFAGPITDNQGKVQLASGVLDDAGLNKMNYYVQGVAGKLPTK